MGNDPKQQKVDWSKVNTSKLSKFSEYYCYVIIVYRDNNLRYISKDYNKKHATKYSTSLETAMKFYSYESAKKYSDNNHIRAVQRIAQVKVTNKVL